MQHFFCTSVSTYLWHRQSELFAFSLRSRTPCPPNQSLNIPAQPVRCLHREGGTVPHIYRSRPHVGMRAGKSPQLEVINLPQGTVKHSVAVNGCRRTLSVADRETGHVEVVSLDRRPDNEASTATDGLLHLRRHFGNKPVRKPMRLPSM